MIIVLPKSFLAVTLRTTLPPSPVPDFYLGRHEQSILALPAPSELCPITEAEEEPGRTRVHETQHGAEFGCRHGVHARMFGGPIRILVGARLDPMEGGRAYEFQRVEVVLPHCDS